MQHDQCFGAMRTIGRLRELGVSSSRWRGDEPEARFPEAPVCTLLVVAGSSTCSGSHAGCTHGMRMFGSAAVAYVAHLAQISRVCVMPLRPGGARESRRSHEFARSTLRMIGWGEMDMYTYGGTVWVNVGQ